VPGYLVTPAARPLDASVPVPGSKSIANRALICAALADGDSVIGEVPGGDDSEAMLDCLIELGVALGRNGRSVHVSGSGGVLRPSGATLRCRLAGTTSRFVTALAALADEPVVIDGEPPLRARPMEPLHDALRQLGVRVAVGDGGSGLPVEVTGPAARNAGAVELRGDVSSQYITALMLVAPYLPGGLRIHLLTPLVSRPYVLITAAVMRAFGHGAVDVGERDIAVSAGRYVATEFVVEPDASSASYPLAAAALVGGKVHVPGLTTASLQGDAGFAGVLASMGCDAVQDMTGTTVTRHGELGGVDIDMVDLSDLVPTFAVAATGAHSPSTVTGVGFIRRKESDRLGDLCAELRRAGADARDQADGLTITPALLHGAALKTHHDHRLAMSFGVLGLAVDGIEVLDPEVVTKSWPEFWTMLESLRE
jgi:3-phosphoshikimate 1-carboxyvinyltransferase